MKLSFRERECVFLWTVLLITPPTALEREKEIQIQIQNKEIWENGVGLFYSDLQLFPFYFISPFLFIVFPDLSTTPYIISSLLIFFLFFCCLLFQLWAVGWQWNGRRWRWDKGLLKILLWSSTFFWMFTYQLSKNISMFYSLESGQFIVFLQFIFLFYLMYKNNIFNELILF